MTKWFFWTQGRNYGKSQFFKQMEEMRMSRNKKIPVAPTEGFEITEVTTNKYRTLPVVNGIVMLDSDEAIRAVTEKRKEDPAIYNPENLGWQRGLDKVDLNVKAAVDKIKPIFAEEKTAEEWRHDKLVKQDQIGEHMYEERYNFLRLNEDALMTKEEWDLVFNSIKEPTTCEEAPEVYVINTGEAYAGVIEELSETFVKKNADYGNSFEKTLDKRGLTPAIIRMEEKMERMEKLWETNEDPKVDESIIDSAMDLANYAIMTAMWLKKIVPELPKDVEIWADDMQYGGADFDGDTV